MGNGLNKCYASNSNSISPTETLIDNGCASAMGSVSAGKRLELALRQKGFKVDAEFSEHLFSFAGGGGPTRSEGNIHAPIPLPKAKM